MDASGRARPTTERRGNGSTLSRPNASTPNATPAPPLPTSGRRSPRAMPSAPRLPVRVPELALGVALVVGCALGAVVWQQRVSAGRQVIVAARAIARGSALDPSQLTEATVRGGEDIALVAAQDASALIGQRALVDIPAGLPIEAALVSPVVPLAPGDALVSVAVGRGHAPADLAPGDPVRVVIVLEPDALEQPSPQLLEDEVTVWGVEPPTDYDASAVVTLRLPMATAASVSGADDVRLVRVGG